MLEIRHLVGLDLGQVNDFTALVSLRQEKEVPEPSKVKAHDPNAAIDWDVIVDPPEAKPKLMPPAKYVCDVAERFERGASYTVLADNMVKLFENPAFAGQTLVVDGTGVGRGVVDIFRKAKPNCILMPVTITGGQTGGEKTLGHTTVDDLGYWHVPKKELVSTVQVLLGTDRLRRQPHKSSKRQHVDYGAVMMNELKNFHYKINAASAHVSYEAWREQEHDDLVLALALAAWAGERAKQQLWVR